MTSSTREVDADGGEGGTVTETAGTEMGENVAGALSYVLGLLTGIVFFLIDDRPFVRFHAAQSMVVSGLMFVAYMALTIVQIVLTGIMFGAGGGGFIVGGILSLLLGLVWLALAFGGFVLWIYLIVRAYQGRQPRVPVAAGIADSLV